jgi:hypothetical protein
MSGMEIPLILGAGGALVGSQVDKKNPLRGALLGGAAGGLGGAALAPASAATTAGTAATSAGAIEATGAAAGAAGITNPFSSAAAYQAAVPGLTSSAAGSQAAMLAAQTGEFGLAGLAQTAGSAYAPGSVGSAAMRALASGTNLSPTQAMAAQRAMGGFQQPQGGTSTQTGAFRPGQQVNLADPIASLLAPKRKRDRSMISLL